MLPTSPIRSGSQRPLLLHPDPTPTSPLPLFPHLQGADMLQKGTSLPLLPCGGLQMLDSGGEEGTSHIVTEGI